jgi:hypothetical protein
VSIRTLKRKENPIISTALVSEGVATEWTAGATPRARDQQLARQQAAAECLGDLAHGLERYIVAKGQFSLIDLLRAILSQTGPAHLTFSTWTAAGLHVSEVYDLVEAGTILSTRWLIDHTFQRRQPHVAGQLHNLFGAQSIRVTRNHAKLALVRNDAWDVTVLTSMNLNVNRRMEFLLVREDHDLAEFNAQWIDDIFRRRRALDNWGKSNSWQRKRFAQD